MADEPNMAEPVTRGELHASLETWAKVIIDQITDRFEKRMDERFAEQTAWFEKGMDERFAEQTAEIARQFRASEERMRDFMRACLEPHDGVPERVTKLEEELVPRVERLEARVFAPKRGAQASRRRRVAKRR